jgi:antitoxin ParD1/3/4
MLGMPTRNVSLTVHLDEFVEKLVRSGRFSNPSEVVSEGLRLLEQREAEEKARVKWLRNAIQEGIDDIEAGRFTTLNSKAEINAFVHEIFEEVRRELPSKKGRG